MPNHFHLLILRGPRPLSELMQHLLTGYAVGFNHRYLRAGHLFQNRYKSPICAKDSYLRELAAYIHLNPLKAGMVCGLNELAGFEWCGHRAALGIAPDGILDRATLLGYFSEEGAVAVRKYEECIIKKASSDAEEGAEAAVSPHCSEGVLSPPQGIFKEVRSADKREREELLAAVEKATGVARADIMRRTREWRIAGARAAYCYLCWVAGGVRPSELMRELGLGQSAISKLISRGRVLAETFKLGI